jgi:DNA-binding NarL/FixJ family response regulator
MTCLSILLIEEQISTAAEVAQVLCHELLDYRLAIVKSVAEAVAAPEPADLILLNSSLLTEDPTGTVSALTQSYPDSFIMLLQVASTEECLLSALAAGADDYVPLSDAGLVVLGRRLANLAVAKKPVAAAGAPDAMSGRALASLLAHDQSPLPLQIIGPDNRIVAWNQAMATFSGLNRAAAVGALIDELPISPRNLGRLKDILDQARVRGEPFAIADYPLEDLQGQSRWGRLYVYPLPHHPPPEEQAQFFDVCILGVNVSDIKEQAVESWKHAQELRLLLEISREVSEQLDLKSTLVKIAEQTKSLLNAATCHIYFLEKNNQTLRPVLAIGP